MGKDRPFFRSLARASPPLSRDRTPDPAAVRRGGYVFREATDGRPDVILLASGSELHLAVEAAEELEAEGIATRVVSLLSWHLFQAQTEEYQNQVLPSRVTARVAVEAAAGLGWERWIGTSGRYVGMNGFGASAPAPRLFQEFGITADAVASAARSLVKAGD